MWLTIKQIKSITEIDEVFSSMRVLSIHIGVVIKVAIIPLVVDARNI